MDVVKIRQILGGEARPNITARVLDGKDSFCSAARVRAGTVVATCSRHEFPMVHGT